MKIIKKITTFLNQHFGLFLLLIVLISYGQILGMYVWKDDNAIFFKFTHLEEQAGYLGAGIFGEGPYKFSVTPYYLIYKIFGYHSIVPFYALILVFYFFSTFAVYKLFSTLISKNAGKAAGFLFASGYIASEGFIWLASSMIINVSVILSSVVVLIYYKFLTSKKLIFLPASWFFYFLLVYLTPVRSHYLIGVIIFMDIIWLIQKFSLKSLFNLTLRLVPFMIFFYWFILKDIDRRASLLTTLLQDIMAGEYFKLFSFFSSLGYMLISDRQIEWLIQLRLGLDATKASILILFLGVIFFLIRKRRNFKIFFLGLIFLNIFWFYLSLEIYSSLQVNAEIYSSLAVFLGGLFLQIFFIVIIFTQRQVRWLAILFTFWLVANLYSYTAYLPINTLLSTDRYFAHSFIPLVGFLALSFAFKGKFTKNNFLICLIVIVWGIINLSNSIIYQRQIILTRSNPAREFYQKLKEYIPEVKKGDVIFFDIAPDAKSYFNAAFSVGQMPESTAIAWRYGLDRYDFKLLTNFAELFQVIKHEKIPPENIYAFWYTETGLVDTSKSVRQALFGQGLWHKSSPFGVVSSKFELNNSLDRTNLSQPDLKIKLEEPIMSTAPLGLKFKITADYARLDNTNFPFYLGSKFRKDGIWQSNKYRGLALEYKNIKNNILKNTSYFVSSEWQNRIKQNIYDQDTVTLWQADRILWDGRKEYVLVDLKQPAQVDKIIWFNGVSNSTPIKYSVDISLDGVSFQEVILVSNISRIEPELMQVIEFKSIKARFVKINFWETLDGDSPAIADLWVIPADLGDLDIKKAEEFLESPFAFIEDKNIYQETLSKLEFLGEAQVYWQYIEGREWYTKPNAKINIKYDNTPQEYIVDLPPGGDKISAIKLSNIQIPGTIYILEMNSRHPSLEELKLKDD